MASFGSFETEREVYSDPTYTVYAARKTGDSKSEYAVKVFSLQRIGFDTETATQLKPLLSDIEQATIQRIAVQQRAAAASRCVTPVFESGRDERGVWYATRFYPRSVNKIISGRVALSREALHHIIRSIAQGALDLKRVCGRAHGDIRPSNVQISKSDKLREAEVVLSDPLPGGENEAALFEISDLRAIGRLLLQLVRQRAIDKEEVFLILPILSAPEWTRVFGEETDNWLALCNRLLDPNLSLEQFTLEQLVAALDQLQPKPAVSPKLVMAVAAGVLLLGIVSLIVWWSTKGSQTQIVEITTDPPGATILVDQKAVPIRSGDKAGLSLKLKKGSHSLEARHQALRLREQSTNVVLSGGAPLKLHFHFPYGSLAITGEPRGATILRDGVPIGNIPADGSPFVLSNLAAGVEVPLRLAKEGYVAKDIVRVIKDGERLVVSEALPKTEDTENVEINSSPSAKVIWQGNVVINDTPGYARLPHGIQSLSLVYSDWPTQTLTLEVKKGSSISTNFDFPRGRVALDSVPPDATVWVGTNRIGNTPMTAVRPVGSTTFRFERIGFETTNQTVTVTDKGLVSIKPVLVTTNGMFELSSDPAGASIFDANGKEIGRATAGKPVKLIRAPGTHSFTARIDGLSDVTATLTVRKGEDKLHTFLFDYGSIRLDSVPSGATIAAEGKVLGLTPATFIQKPGLKSSYQITAPDYLPQTNEVTVQSGDRDKIVVAKLLPEPVNVTLTSDPPGAQFYFSPALSDTQRAGLPLPALSNAERAGGSIYPLPWGTNRVTGRHPLYPALGELTKFIEVKKGAQNISHFPFDYGTIILTNLPEEIIIKEGNRQVWPSPPMGDEANKPLSSLVTRHSPLLTRPGSHLYDVYDDAGQKITNVTINVQSGRSSIPPPGLVGEIGEIRNSIGMRLVKVRNLVGPGKDGWVGKYEVTQREYQMVMGNNPSINQLGENYPVENVTWEQAIEFCQKLKVSDEKKPPLRGDYRLPSKEQWLFFAEGTDSKDAVKNAKTPAPVGSKPPNPKRLYDVLGNVWEWLADTDGVNSVFIGGAYNIGFGFRFGAYEQRAKTFHEAAVGFRVVLIPPNATASTQ